jgi:predicted dehydrogenase
MVEVDPIRFSYLTERWKSNPRVRVVRDIPDESAFSLVLIATPPKFHYRFWEQTMQRTTHALIEKPMTMNVDEAEKIVDASNMGGAKVYVNLIRRLLINYTVIRSFYLTKRFGDLLDVKIFEGGVFNWEAVSIGSFNKALNGGGVLMDTGPHTIDLAFQVFSSLDVEAAYMDAWGKVSAIEANCILKLRADGSIPVLMSLSRNRNLSNKAIFRFEDATCILGVRDNSAEVATRQGTRYQLFPPNRQNLPPMRYPEFFDMFYEQFIMPGDNTSVGPRESLDGIRVIEDAYKKAEPMKETF